MCPGFRGMRKDKWENGRGEIKEGRREGQQEEKEEKGDLGRSNERVKGQRLY